MRPPFWGGNLGLLLDLPVCFRHPRYIFFSLFVFNNFPSFLEHIKIRGTRLYLKTEICNFFIFFCVVVRRTQEKCKMNGIDGFIISMPTTLR